MAELIQTEWNDGNFPLRERPGTITGCPRQVQKSERTKLKKLKGEQQQRRVQGKWGENNEMRGGRIPPSVEL
jgi:hypothetical protein